MNATLEKTDLSHTLATAVGQHGKQFPLPEAFQSLRNKALAAFEKQGLPQRKNEEYKYSPVAALFKNELRIGSDHGAANQINAGAFQIEGLDAFRIVLINGRVFSGMSDKITDSERFRFYALSDFSEKPAAAALAHFGKYADIKSDPFTALNTAAFEDILFITVPDNTVVARPILILNIITSQEAALISPRILVHAGKKTSVEIIEQLVSDRQNPAVVCNALSEIVVEDDAKVLFYKIQDQCTDLQLICTTQVLQKERSHFDTHTVTLSGGWVRNNLNIVPDASHCETHLNGLFILKENQHTDNHTLVDHRKPHCESNQLYRGILYGRSTGVFNGKIFVRPDAQKTNAYQSSKNMLLSDDASINTKPQLEIYADDVKCSHGSSTGQIDENALFYLRARGIGTESAKALLMVAFARDVINTLRVDALRNHIEAVIEKRLTH
jgi:Fe-S cluster assembly protein SufD